MNTLLLTVDGGLYGKKILASLARCGVPLAGIVIIRQPWRYSAKLYRSVARRVGWLDASIFAGKRVLRFLSGYDERRSAFRGQVAEYVRSGVPCVWTKGTNTRETVEKVRGFRPDLVLLAQTGIVRDHLLSVPRIGTLNVHPGMLPAYRGVDCARWSIYKDDWESLGATAHWVDRGVDTGRIIRVARYELRGDESLDLLDVRLDDLSARIMAETVRSIAGGSIADGRDQLREEGRQYYKMSRSDEAIARNKLRRRLRGLNGGTQCAWR